MISRLVLALLTLTPAAASAHAILVDSVPTAAASVPAGHVAIRLRFNSRIDHARSRLALNRPGASPTVLPIGASDPPDIMTSDAELAAGSYVLRWQVLAVDGHITRGDVAFGVAAPTP